MSAKDLRKSTYLALMGVVVTALALVTATYAWFVNNGAAEAEQMNFTASASSELQIAVDSPGATAENQGGLNYKSIIMPEDAADYLAKVNNPAGGRTPGLIAVSTVSAAAFYTNRDLGNAERAFEFFKPVTAEEGFYFALPVWFRSNRTMSVYLGEGTFVKAREGALGNARYFPRAVRVGFGRIKGDGTDALLESAIYEPDPEAGDPDVADSQVTGRKNTTVFPASQTAGDGYGIAAVDASGRISAAEPQVKYPGELPPGETGLSMLVKPPAAGGIPSAENTDVANKVPVCRMEEGLPQKAIIYVWIDGMDYDCVPGISNATLEVKLNFVGVEPAP